MTLKPPTKTFPKLVMKEWPSQPFKADDARVVDKALRDYLLNNNRGEATLTLRSAVDDYAGFLTGNREALWAQDARSIQPKWD